MTRKILIILDGFADSVKDGKTSLEMAKTPNLDFIASKGECGLMWPIKGIAPESGASQFVLLGGKLKDYPRRGVIEAVGADVKMNKKDLAIRINFAKASKGKITQIRVNIPSEDIISKLNKIDKDIKIIPTVGYRGIMIVKNAGTADVSNTHPGYETYRNYSRAISIHDLTLKKCIGDKGICRKINEFVYEAERIMGGGRTMLLREAGLARNIPKVKKMKNWVFMGDMPVERGLAKIFGMKLMGKSKGHIKEIIHLKENVYIQIKGADPFGHIGDKKGKVKAIRNIDEMLKPLKELCERKDVVLCITSDHATPPELKRHSADAVPVLIYNGKDKDDVGKFCEKNCVLGKLGKFEGKDLMSLMK